MKKKIVIKVCMPCDKCRSKALEVVAKADGLISVVITGDDGAKLEVVGDGIDPVCLVKCLRRKLCCFAEILKVEDVKDKPEPPKTPQPVVVCPPPPCCPGYCYCRPPPPMIVCEDNNCAIM